MDFPKSVAGVGLVNGKFVDENKVTGQVGSLIPSVWGNAVTDELLNVIRAAGLNPDEGKNTQLLEALRATGVFQTPATGDRSTKAATTQMFADEFVSSRTSNGYQKFSSGLIIQWASGSNYAASAEQTIVLPITFPTAHLQTLVTNVYASASQNGTYGFISATTSRVVVARSNTDNGVGVTPRIISIGY